MSSPPVGAPVYWRERTFNIAEMTLAANVPHDTFSSWHRMMRAMGHTFGSKILNKWSFNAHEMYTLHLIASIYRIGHPITTDVMRTVLNFSDGGGMNRPFEGLMIGTDGTAYVAVDAKRCWDMTLVNCQSMEAGTDGSI